MAELFSQNISKRFPVDLELPDNLEALQGDMGRALFWVPFALAPVVYPSFISLPFGGGLAFAITNWTGAHADQLRLARDTSYSRSAEPDERATSTLYFNLDVKALQRDSGEIDIALEPNISFSVQGPSDGQVDERIKLLYQDNLAFGAYSLDPDWGLNNKSVAPQTQQNQATYTYSTGWSATTGFDVPVDPTKGGTVKPGMTVTFNTTSSTVVRDFNLAAVTDPSGQAGVGWRSEMNLCYDGASQTFEYDVRDPYSIVINGVFTKWLKEVPLVSKNGFYIKLLAPFSSNGSGKPKNTRPRFDLVCQQRLSFAYIAGRSGAPGARVGGIAVVVPMVVEHRATLVVDCEKKQAFLENVKQSVLKAEGYYNRAAVGILTKDGAYLSVSDGRAKATAGSLGDREKFVVYQDGDDSRLRFRSAPENKFVCAEGGGGGDVSVNRDVPYGWETFVVEWPEREDGAFFVLKTYDGHYLRVEPGTSLVTASANGHSEATRFRLELGRPVLV